MKNIFKFLMAAIIIFAVAFCFVALFLGGSIDYRTGVNPFTNGWEFECDINFNDYVFLKIYEDEEREFFLQGNKLAKESKCDVKILLDEIERMRGNND